MAIHLILGKQGSGKTLLAVKMALDLYTKHRTIYSNVHLSFNYEKINYMDIIECNLSRSVILLDEIHLLLPSRRSLSKRNTEICDKFLSMARKQNTEIIGTTQTMRKVDIRYREEADFLYYCTKYVYDETKKKWVESLYIDEFDDKIPVIIDVKMIETTTGEMRSISFMGNPLYYLYDTYQIIKIEGLPEEYTT